MGCSMVYLKVALTAELLAVLLVTLKADQKVVTKEVHLAARLVRSKADRRVA